MARALAADPPVLLMDEPFSAIDPIARDRLQGEFLRVQEAVRKTIVFVTHDIDEAVRLGDRIAVFRQGGVLEQYDTPGLGARRAGHALRRRLRGGRPRAAPPRGDADRRRPTSTRRRSWPCRTTLGAGPPGAADPASRSCSTRPARCAATSRPTGSSGDGTVADRLRRLPAAVPADATLKAAMAEMLQHDAGWVAVLEPGSDRYLGVLTPTSLHAELRRSVQLDED